MIKIINTSLNFISMISGWFKSKSFQFILKWVVCLMIAFPITLLPFITVSDEVTSPDEEVIWWVAGDTHVGHNSEPALGQHLATAVADVNNLDIADYAVILGDLVEDSYEFSTPFIQEMNKLNIGWTYVLGNHDFDSVTHEPVLPVHFSARTVSGIRFIFLSDELTGYHDRDLIMREDQSKWFWEELEANRGKPVFIFSHQPHPEFGEWPALKEKLGDYDIVAWVSAHKHSWNMEKYTDYGFTQVNIHSVGGVRDDYLSTFLKMERTGEMVTATVTYRNHETQEWIEVEGEKEFTFSIEL